MGILPEILNRRSVDSFTGDTVSREVMDRILEAGRLAPSAKNRQPWRFIAVESEDTRRRIQEAAYGDERVGQCAWAVAVCSTNIDYRMPNGQLSYPVDLAIAASFMLLQAEHEKLGTCLLTTYREDEIREILTVPYGMKVVLLLLVSPARGKPETSPRFPVSRVISYNHW